MNQAQRNAAHWANFSALKSRLERAANVLAINFDMATGYTLGGRDPVEVLREVGEILYEEEKT